MGLDILKKVGQQIHHSKPRQEAKVQEPVQRWLPSNKVDGVTMHDADTIYADGLTDSQRAARPLPR